MYKRIGWGFACVACLIGLCIWAVVAGTMQLGIDLRGGTELTYSLDLSHFEKDRAEIADKVKDHIARRLNAYGLKEISVSVQGQNHLVIQVPGTDEESIRNLKMLIETAGEMTFRLVATNEYQDSARQKKLEEEELAYLAQDRAWVEAKLKNPALSEERPKPPEYIVRTYIKKEDLGQAKGKAEFVPGGKYTLENFHVYNPSAGRWEPDGVVSGRYLSRVSDTYDNFLKPAVGFEFRGTGAMAFGELTGNNVGRLLSIVLDDSVMQVATIKERISSSGQISGSFTPDEVVNLVTILRGGSLPTKPNLISENKVGALLGQDSIRSGIRAAVVGTAGVMLSMAIYYMIGGLVADAALAFNLLIIVAFVVAFRQTLTMPGIAGLLLTLAMAVDANILIFERYREERKKGKPLAQSIAAGYDRAFWVIFDSNLTTIITGYVLFYLGTPEVKGFAVTLISGLFASFFTSVFVTRLIISFLCNFGIVRDIKMMEAFATPRVPFVKFQKRMMLGSVVVIALTWVVVLWRGRENYGIDFTGGARITMNLVTVEKVEDMRKRIDAIARENPELFLDYSIQTVGAVRPGESSTYALLTRAGSSASLLKKASAEEVKPATSPATGQETGAAPAVPATPPATESPKTETPKPEATPAPPAPTASTELPPAVPAPATKAEEAPAVPSSAPKTEAPPAAPGAPPGGAPPAPAGTAEISPELVDATGQPIEAQREPAQLVSESLEKSLGQQGLLRPSAFPAPSWPSATSAGAPSGSVYLEMQVNLWQVKADLKTEDFQNEINAFLEKDPLLRKAGRESSAEYQGIQVSSVELVGKPTPEMPVTRYVIRTTPYRPPLEAGSLSDRTVPTKRQVEDAIRSYFRGQPKEKLEISEPFDEVLTVGPRVASNLQLDALVAVFISFLGIVFYLSLRFEFIYGFAGVLALVHDVMVAIGIMAVTDQFLPSFTIKFNLNELAAILTIIGFSINDTIVLFDRIRENSEILAKRKYTLEDIVDISVNQTLSRTLWTSMTVLMVLVILLAFGGDSVRGFSFLFAVGTVSGVYSTVFIAAPVAIYMNKRALRRRQQMALAEQ